MALQDVVKELKEFKIQLDKAWFNLNDDPKIKYLHDLNFASQVFAAKVVYRVEEETLNYNEKAPKTS